MKTVLVLAGLVAMCLAGAVPTHQSYDHVETKPVSKEFVEYQKKILTFFEYTRQVDPEAEYYKIGMEYDIENSADFYTNKAAYEEFLRLYKTGFLPKYKVFSVFEERMREEAIALFKLFYYAKDFETFYKTAAFARVHFNEYQFYYSFYIAVYHRPDTQGIVLPAPYEVFNEYFINMETMFQAYRFKMQDGLVQPNKNFHSTIVPENDYYVFYSNYSNYFSYDKDESKLAYFTEDIGLNSYYFYFHNYFPFWMEGEKWGILKERRGEVFYFYYQQLLSRYYMERLTNGLGEIPQFNWYAPLKSGYSPFLTTYGHPFVQRNDYYYLPTPENMEDIQFLDTYEKTFLQFLQRGHFKAYNQEVDFHNSKAINFVGNYWESNYDLFEKSGPRNYIRSYETVARRLLSATPEPIDKYTVAPAALENFASSLRDPVFWQLYSKILNYVLQYKEYLEPYTQDQLHYVGVKINDVTVDKLVTYYEYYDHEVHTGVFYGLEEFKHKHQTPALKIRQPRLTHKPFTVNFDVKSDVSGDAVFKIFLGPKYESTGYPLPLEDNWMNFVELDWFKHTLTQGQNKIERSSDEFFYFKDDSIPIPEIYKLLEQGKVPIDMSERYEFMPNRLMLPKGTPGGFPFQLYVFVYPYQEPSKEYEPFKNYLIDTKPFGYPFDRPVESEYFFIQPNMYFKDVSVFFEGEYFPYTMNNPFFFHSKNQVPH